LKIALSLIGLNNYYYFCSDMNKLKNELYSIIFGTDTKAGRFFDLSLLFLILLSIFIVMLESVPYYNAKYSATFEILEWGITILFFVEYIIRIWVLDKPFGYIFSFYGVIDFLSILPSFAALFMTGTRGLIVLRGMRLIRVFRILHLPKYSEEGRLIVKSLSKSRHKISVFLMTVIAIVIIVATLMYSIEGPENGFTSIPESLYWSVVTITTVGYGDIAPHTAVGKFIASILMLLGYAIIAVPTGIVTASYHEVRQETLRKKQCQRCGNEKNDHDARYCSRCGEPFGRDG
jgi:voltage-gated potassium channel